MRFESSYAALYFPWLLVIDPARPDADVRPIPPSGHVAAPDRADRPRRRRSQGARQRAPRVGPGHDRADRRRDSRRAESGRNQCDPPVCGARIRIFGARTVSSDPDLRFVSVRRLLLMIEKALLVATQWAAFERRSTYARQADAFDLEFPPRDLAERRARGLVGRRGVLREMRRRDDPGSGAGPRRADRARRSRADGPVRVRRRARRTHEQRIRDHRTATLTSGGR